MQIMHMTTMKDQERLDLLKEIGGTKVYEERREESLKVMKETEGRRKRIEEVVGALLFCKALTASLLCTSGLYFLLEAIVMTSMHRRLASSVLSVTWRTGDIPAVCKGYFLGDLVTKLAFLFFQTFVRCSVVTDRLLSWRNVWPSWMRSVRSWPNTGKWTRRDAAWSTPSMTKISMKPDLTWRRYAQLSLRGQLCMNLMSANDLTCNHLAI